MNENTPGSGQPETTSKKYRVVALRYRPGSFDDLIGQTQVATALGNAIEQNRVGHAYLFTGARGVGKTSSARIFAKCLNCVQGPTTQPCGECDICHGVATGEDVDVIEIDGASNRGIDEIRQLRANANVRPGRARYKIYIIDEVHMLTVAAFNALLKTLEEPPAHVKFIFCTTDPEKIPITVLSRCQRFDFPPIKTQSIAGRLRHIVDQENIEADDKALELLARRAGGSMRDSQSLLEQLLSYSKEKITVADVHALLGTADNDSVFELAEAMVGCDSVTALTRVHRSIEAGVDAGQLTGQLLGLFRDGMACLVGCDDELMLNCSADDMPRLQQLSQTLGVEKVLSILQVLDQTLVKVRHSSSVRTLLETSVVRCCHLQNIDQIPHLINQLQSDAASPTGTVGSGGPPKRKKKPPEVKGNSHSGSQSDDQRSNTNAVTGLPPQVEPANNVAIPSRPATPGISTQESTSERTANAEEPKEPSKPIATEVNLEPANVEETWRNILAEFNDLTAESAGNFDQLELRDNCLQVTLKSQLDHKMCDRPGPKQRLEEALLAATGKKIRIEFRASLNPETAPVRPPQISRRQRIRQMEQNEFVKSAIELFDGEIVDVKPPPRNPAHKP